MRVAELYGAAQLPRDLLDALGAEPLWVLLTILPTANLPNTYCKSVKFVERPNLEQLRREVDLVRNCLDYISGCASDLDLMLTIQLLYGSGN